MIRKTITITNAQAEWIDYSCINLSKLVRQLLEDYHQEPQSSSSSASHKPDCIPEVPSLEDALDSIELVNGIVSD